METYILGPLDDYELVDSGGGEKLERFGQYLLRRPDPNAVWNKRMDQNEWAKADAIFHVSPSTKVNQGRHWENKHVKEPWKFTFDELSMWLHLTPFKHTGLFPEQILNWEWFGELIKNKSGATPAKVLNLFGYTGGATLYSALKGASVTHVDASKPSINWAIENQKLSGLEKAPIRWIVDDAYKFVSREIKRGNLYDGVILDPPAFGRDPKGKVFKFEENVPELLKLVKKVLSLEPLFVLFNSYATGYSPEVIKNMLADVLPEEKIKFGELAIKEKSSDRRLPTGQCARFEA
jgi:23S rRNA (cytosine1962-C5)-methyltransferase